MNNTILMFNNLLLLLEPGFIEYLSNIITVAGVVALILTIREFRRGFTEQQKQKLNNLLHAINTIKYQLNVIGDWSSYETGGYDLKNIESWKEDSFASRGDPIQWVFDISSNSLQQFSSLPSVEDLGQEINQQIATLNQYIVSFNCTNTEIREFRHSRDPNKNILLHYKLINNLTANLTYEENQFAHVLVDMYTMLHFNIIGNKDTVGIHSLHAKLVELLDSKEKEITLQLIKLG